MESPLLTPVLTSLPESERAQRRRANISGHLHRIGRITAHPAFAVVAAIAVIAFLVALAVAGFPGEWENTFMTFAAAVTVVMVFVIQHTQSRQQIATQLKLDELVRAMPRADDRLVHIEVGSEAELFEIEQEHLEHHVALRDDRQPSPERTDDGVAVE